MKYLKYILGSAAIIVLGVLAYNQSFGAGLTVTLLHVTNTEAVLQYTAPSGSACTVVVSPSATLSPVINDASSTLFTNANLDTSRDYTTASGTVRTLTIGKRSADLALDGNRYSRALQAYTTYYYQITCGANIGSGSFFTHTLESGMTYSDTIPGTASTTPAWPTVNGARNQQIIDPQTGVLLTAITNPTDKANGNPAWYPSTLNFSDNAGNDFCSPIKVADFNGDMGYHCIISGVLFWIDPTNNTGWPVGQPLINPDGVVFFSSQACGGIDSVDPNKFYCIATDSNGNQAIATLEYSGTNTVFSYTFPTCNGSNQPCTTQTDLTPGTNDLYTLMHNFDNSFSKTFNFYGLPPVFRSLQNNSIIFSLDASIQDSYAWLGVFNIGNGVPVGQASSTAGISAEMTTYANYPIRWCSDHSITPIGSTVPWISEASNNLGQATQFGYGTYETNIVGGSLSAATSTCPGNPFGDSVCSSLTVTGEPCNPYQTVGTSTSASCGITGANYLQSAAPGDILGISHISGTSYAEFLQIVTKSGNNWTVARGLSQTPITSHASGELDELCTAHETVSPNYFNVGWIWNWPNDPHGTGTVGSTFAFNSNSSFGHAAYRPNLGIQVDNNIYQILPGGVPAYATVTPVNISDLNPPFSGVTGIGFPNTVDSHPAPFNNNLQFTDARPMQAGITYNSAATTIATSTYKYAAGSIVLNRKTMATIAYSNSTTTGPHILVDISGPNSNIASSSDYSYCVVVNAGECSPGSQPTEVYVKASTATETDCPLPNVGDNGWTHQQICIGDNSMYNQGIAQVGQIVNPDGKNGRMITHALTAYNRQDVFWNAPSTPNEENIFFTLQADPVYASGSGQLFVASPPPFTLDNTLRDNFEQIPVTVPAVSGATSANIEFGYAENGTLTNYYCTSRQEACYKGTESGTNYDFATATPVSCGSGCVINLPLIPERVAFYKINYFNSGGSIISTSTGVTASDLTGSSGATTNPIINMYGNVKQFISGSLKMTIQGP